jgi:putative transposase
VGRHELTHVRDLAVILHNPEAMVVAGDPSKVYGRKFVKALKDAGIVGSMGRVAACADNAAMESFFSLLQKNVLDRRRWDTRAELRLAIVIWIEKKYHRRRRQRGLGRLTPVEFETIYQAAEAA